MCSKLDAFQKTLPVQIEILPQYQMIRTLLYAFVRGYDPRQVHRRQLPRTGYPDITVETRIYRVTREAPYRFASFRRTVRWGTTGQ